MASDGSRRVAGRPASKLLCRNGCGFFGNPEWHWYCSKCWREQATHPRPPPLRASDQPPVTPTPPTSVRRSIAASSGPEAHSAPGSRAESSFRQRFKLTPKATVTDWRQAYATLPPLAQHPASRQAGQALAEHLTQRVDAHAWSAVFPPIHTLVEKIYAHHDTVPIDEIASQVQDGYLSLKAKFHQWAMSDEIVQISMALSEAYICRACLSVLFCPSSTNDEDKDLKLQARIRSLNWITTKELNCVINESSQQVRDLLHDAINDILGLDSQPTPQAKLQCLVTCSKKLFEMLMISNEKAASADEFLPCLIYVCLKANPPRLQSNINFITRFCVEDNLRMGEGGYFFANLCCALSFIESMDASSVDMDSQDFHNYTTGRALPPGSWKCTLLMSEGLQALALNKRTLESLNERQKNILNQSTMLNSKMETFAQDIHQQVEEVLQKTAYTILPSIRVKPKPGLPRPALPESAESEESTSRLLNFEGCSTRNPIPGIVCQNTVPDPDPKDLLELDGSLI